MTLDSDAALNKTNNHNIQNDDDKKKIKGTVTIKSNIKSNNKTD